MLVIVFTLSRSRLTKRVEVEREKIVVVFEDVNHLAQEVGALEGEEKIPERICKSDTGVLPSPQYKKEGT